MNDTVASTGISGTPPAPVPAKASAPRNINPFYRALSIIASLRLTVILFALSMVLVFVGTLAQKDAGIWYVVGTYFRSWYVWVPFQNFFPSTGIPTPAPVHGGFPFLGGWSIGVLLFVNVVAAHAVRFRYTFRHAGIVLIHAGIIVLMAGELITGRFAVEGNMTIPQGGSSNFTEIREKVELAVISPIDGTKKDHQVVIPENILRDGVRIKSAELPFDLEVIKYMINSKRVKPAAGAESDNLATAGYGLETKVVEQPPVSGADPNQTHDAASAYVRLFKKNTDEAIDTFLVSIWFSAITDLAPQRITLDGKTYDLELRFKRAYKPYSVHLKKFRHDLYPGTNTPKNFSSEVRLLDPERAVDRTTVISMNNPLRYHGETFFQASFLPDDAGTVLQVVRNPGWQLPYISCILVGLGLVTHFGRKLVNFLNRGPA